MTVRSEIAQSRRVAPIATKRNGYPALRREAGAPCLGVHEGGVPPSWGSYKGAGPFVGVGEAGFRAEPATVGGSIPLASSTSLLWARWAVRS